MVTLRNKQFFINDKPELILAGEIHYYRLDQKDWQKAIDELKTCGCNAVATYVPWLCHEFNEGAIDLTGKYHERHDITKFIEMCTQNDLYIIVRPGPFIMAEMKNEGLPFWVYEKHPEVVPITWDSNSITTKTIDYLHPDFLACAKRWYEGVMPLFSKNLITNGGKIIAVQLDNEIGMLSWVSNCPVLTDFNLSLFCDWLIDTYSEAAHARYGFIIEHTSACFDQLRSPSESIILEFHKDLGYFMRQRFKKYVAYLKEYAEACGIKDVPFIVNIHGSGGPRGTGYPIGISQLFESYNYSDDFLPGSDFYIGEIHIGNFQDVYLANIFTDCVNTKNQPLSSMEFEAGDGNYGNNFDSRNSPSAIDIKTRMFIAQGNKLLNYYLFSGGENHRFSTPLNDGNDRIAFTGQKHGYAAPIDHALRRTTTYDKTQQVITTMLTNSRSLSTMHEDYDNLSYAFIPDYYMTEYHYPKSEKEQHMINEVRRIRDGGTWNVLAKSLLLTNHSFNAINIQNNTISETLPQGHTLVVTTALYLSAAIQKNIVDFIKQGGNTLIYGELPIYDMEGNTCTILIDHLGVTINKLHRQSHLHYTSIYPCGFADGHDELICLHAQTVSVDHADVFLRVYEDDGICGFTKQLGTSQVACLLTPFHSNLNMLSTLFEKVGIKRHLSHDYFWHGIFITTNVNDQSEKFYHIINLDDCEKELTVFENEIPVFENKILLKPRTCLMLPQNIAALPDVKIDFSTAEIYQTTNDSITFHLTQHTDMIFIQTNKEIIAPEAVTVTAKEGGYVLSIFSKAQLNDYLTIQFK